MPAGGSSSTAHALRDEAMDGAAYLLVVATQEVRPLRPSEDTTVETGESDPLGAASCPAESLKRLRASQEMVNHDESASPSSITQKPPPRLAPL